MPPCNCMASQHRKTCSRAALSILLWWTDSALRHVMAAPPWVCLEQTPHLLHRPHNECRCLCLVSDVHHIEHDEAASSDRLDTVLRIAHITQHRSRFHLSAVRLAPEYHLPNSQRTAILACNGQQQDRVHQSTSILSGYSQNSGLSEASVDLSTWTRPLNICASTLSGMQSGGSQGLS